MSKTATLSELKGISEKDRKMIAETEAMFGAEPTSMGFAKNLFWGRFRNDLVFPYPQPSKEQQEKTDRLIAELEQYMKHEHPSVEIDQAQHVPDWALRRLFDMGVMGMTVPEEYGGLGLGVTAYNRALETIGRYCGSTSVIVSAHQSIGCKAIMLFGTEAQKKHYLPKVAREYLSAFCLSEPQVGSDAAGQETTVTFDEATQEYVLNGEKKWSTSGAMAGIFTVLAKHRFVDPKTGKAKDGVTALIVTPDMPGVDVFQKNRSKTGIRGTWQARIRFTNVRVPKENRLHDEGRGLNVALTCLNYGRCTLSAGVGGGAKQAFEQATKWVQTRYQFNRPLSEFELVRHTVAKMSALVYAMDAMLYMMTGMLDRHDKDIMVETAMTKVFCSHFGWQVIDDAMQIMGGEGYMTENEFERIWRDNRIHRIVEGSNEVMQSFVFAYGGKQLAEQMIGIQQALLWDSDEGFVENLKRLAQNGTNPDLLRHAIPLALQLFAGVKPGAPEVGPVHPLLEKYAAKLSKMTQAHSHFFKMVSKWEQEAIVTRQAQQARLADNAILLYALACALAKMDHQMRARQYGAAYERDRAAFEHLFDLFQLKFVDNLRQLRKNADATADKAADTAYAFVDTLPDSDFYIHESSPSKHGQGKVIPTAHILQFPGDVAMAELTGGASQGDGAGTIDELDVAKGLG